MDLAGLCELSPSVPCGVYVNECSEYICVYMCDDVCILYVRVAAFTNFESRVFVLSTVSVLVRHCVCK